MFNATVIGAEEYSAGVQRKVIDNGATIVVKYVPGSPLVTVQVRVLSGLSNEGEYAGSGISHFLEHLLFKGTRDKNAEEVRKEIKMLGGVANGSTGLDSAEYHITVPAENFEKALLLLAAMVMELEFTDEELEKEREVIMGEMRLNNDDPLRKRLRLLFSQAYREHVYKYPIIGYKDRLKALMREDLERYHSSVYTPDRIVIGIAGGVPPEKAISIAEDNFKDRERGGVWQINISEEPRQIDERISRTPEEVIVGYLAIGFHTTDLYSPDLYSGDVLSILLGEGSDSRLYKKLVKEKELLYTVSSLNYTPKYPGLFVVVGTGEPDKMDEAREEILKVIEELKDGKVDKGEIERAKNMVISRYLASHESVESAASSMTSSEIMTGDPSFYEKYVEKVKTVGMWQIKNAAMQYLNGENSTTVILLPEDFYKEAVSEGAMKEKKGEDGEEFTTLDNGLRVVVKRRSRLPLVSVTLAMAGGLRAENARTNGISSFMTYSMLKGTKRRKESEIVPQMEKMGGGIKAFSGANSMGVTMSLISEDLGRGMDIFEDVARNASFPGEEISKLKKKMIASIKEQEKSIFDTGLLEFRKELYGNHPYGLRTIGEIETVEGFTRDDVAGFNRKYWGPENAVLTVVGDVDIGEVLRDITKRFRDWEGGSEKIGRDKAAPLNERKQEEIVMRKEQSLFLVGFLGVETTDERRYALQVISALLSGSDGLLFDVLREKGALAYSSGAVSIPAVDLGYFVIYAAIAEGNIADVKKKILELMEKIRSGDISREELAAAKSRIITQYASGNETNSELSMTIALDELYGLGFNNYKAYPDKIRAVTMKDVKNTAKEILDISRSATVIIHSK